MAVATMVASMAIMAMVDITEAMTSAREAFRFGNGGSLPGDLAELLRSRHVQVYPSSAPLQGSRPESAGLPCRNRVGSIPAIQPGERPAASPEMVNRMRPLKTMESWVNTLHSRT